MISSKRVNKLKKDINMIYKKASETTFIIKAKEGLFLYDLTKNPLIESQKKQIEKPIRGIEIEDISESSIENIVVVAGEGYHLNVIIDDIEDDPEGKRIFKEYFIENNILNYKNLTNEQLKEIAAIE